MQRINTQHFIIECIAILISLAGILFTIALQDFTGFILAGMLLIESLFTFSIETEFLPYS